MWDYTDTLMDHFRNPRNVGEIPNADGMGEVGNISCGDALRFTFRIDKTSGVIVDAKFKTFGCGSAIASASMLTELVKGKTLEEARKLTNKDIADALGGVPEEKMHCSVMGMEALQAAIANFRGEKPAEHDDTDHEGRVVCHCFGVTDVKILKLAKENNLRTIEAVTNYCKAGGACGRCHGEINEILESIWRDKNPDKDPEPAATTGSSGLTLVQKVMRIQQVIDKDIRPTLEADGGSLEFVDLRGDTVLVRLKGRCAVCPTSHITIRHAVEAKLKEYVAPELVVEEVKHAE